MERAQAKTEAYNAGASGRIRSPWLSGLGHSAAKSDPFIERSLDPFGGKPPEHITNGTSLRQDEEQAETPRRLSRAASILFPAGVAITVLGLIVTRSQQVFNLTFLPSIVNDTLKQYISNYQEALVGGIICLTGALVAGFAGRTILPDKLAGLSLPLPRLRRDLLTIIMLAPALACEALLCWHLATQQYTHWDIALFFAGLLLLGLTVHRVDTPKRPSTLHLTRFDAFITVLLGIYAGLINSVDLTGWNFAWIGDEGAFFGMAHAIVHGDVQWNLFQLDVVYNEYPMMDSVYQGLVMKVFGDNVFGWRFSEVLVMVASTALVYLLGVALFGRIAGVAAGVILASNHYLMAFTHIAYNNTHMVFYSALAMLMLVLAWRTQRAVFVYGTGVAIGLCFYTVQGALLIWPTIALLLFTIFLRKPTWAQIFAGLLMLLGFVVVVTPGLLTTPLSEIISAGTFLSHREASITDPALVTRTAFVQSSVIFWDNNQWADHYVAGPLVDFVTGVLLFVGVVISLLRLGKRADRLLLIWFLAGLAMLAVTTYQPRPPVTRLLYLMPPVALLAGMVVYKLNMVLRIGLRLPSAAAHAVVAAMLVVIPFLNLNQLLVNSPATLSFSPFALILKAIEEHPEQTIVEVGTEPDADQNLMQMLSWYPWYDRHYEYINVSDLKNPGPQGSHDSLPIFLVVQSNESIIRRVENVLTPGYPTTEDFDPGHTTYVWLFEPEVTTIGTRP